jgi:hypothetical protein
MKTLPLAVGRMKLNVMVGEPMHQRESASFPPQVLQALLVWREGGRLRNCAARLLHAGRGEITLILFGAPVPGTWTRLHFVDPPWCGAARVVKLTPGIRTDGHHQAQLKLPRDGWSEWKAAFLSAPSPEQRPSATTFSNRPQVTGDRSPVTNRIPVQVVIRHQGSISETASPDRSAAARDRRQPGPPACRRRRERRSWRG